MIWFKDTTCNWILGFENSIDKADIVYNAQYPKGSTKMLSCNLQYQCDRADKIKLLTKEEAQQEIAKLQDPYPHYYRDNNIFCMVTVKNSVVTTYDANYPNGVSCDFDERWHKNHKNIKRITKEEFDDFISKLQTTYWVNNNEVYYWDGYHKEDEDGNVYYCSITQPAGRKCETITKGWLNNNCRRATRKEIEKIKECWDLDDKDCLQWLVDYGLNVTEDCVSVCSTGQTTLLKLRRAIKQRIIKNENSN